MKIHAQPLLKCRRILANGSVLAAAALISSSALRADQTTAAPDPSSGPASAPATDSRFGLFDWLDHRSAYSQDAFPEPFLVDDSALEVDEARLDWLHTQATHNRSDRTTAEVEKGFGLLTLELEVPFEYDKTTHPADTTKGFDNLDLGARYPVYQFVSGNQFVDLTVGTAIEVGIPTGSPLSRNTELVPKMFGDLKLGDQFTVQSIFGYSKLFGGGDDGGLATFEYGFVFGYTIPHAELPLPDVLQFIPVFELSGETELNKADPGHNSLLGDAGFRVNLKALGPIQPRLGLAYVFPIDNGARNDVRRGVITSLVFEY